MHAGLEIQTHLLGHRGLSPTRSVSPGENMTCSPVTMFCHWQGNKDMRGMCSQNPFQRISMDPNMVNSGKTY